MPKLHHEIFTKEQNKLLPLVAKFSKNFYLVGGTAIALHLGHRRSIDFDLFSSKKIGNQTVLNKIISFASPDKIIVNKLGELTLIVRNVKFTFFHYSYSIICSESLGYTVKMPDLLTLAAMKAFALGQRAKWKDYVDLYFIIKDHFSISRISQKGKEVFSGFNEKLFRSQLAYFEGINYSEPIEYLPGFHADDKVIKKALIEFALEK